MPHLVAFSSELALFEPRVHSLRHRRDRIRIRGGLHESTAHALAAPPTDQGPFQCGRCHAEGGQEAFRSRIFFLPFF